MKNLWCAVGFALVLSCAHFAAAAAKGVAGKWIGSFVITLDGETREEKAHLELKLNGTELTGTGGPNAKQWPIQNGKITGNQLTFEILTGGKQIKFELSLENDQLKGTAKAEHEGRHESRFGFKAQNGLNTFLLTWFSGINICFSNRESRGADYASHRQSIFVSGVRLRGTGPVT